LVRPGVNFINILRTNFSYECRFGSFFYLHVTRKKLPKQRSYEKFVSKMLMKLTPVFLKSWVVTHFWVTVTHVWVAKTCVRTGTCLQLFANWRPPGCKLLCLIWHKKLFYKQTCQSLQFFKGKPTDGISCVPLPIILTYGSPNCVFFCFVGHQLSNVENQWVRPYMEQLSMCLDQCFSTHWGSRHPVGLIFFSKLAIWGTL